MENKDMFQVLDRLAGSLESCSSMHQVYLDSLEAKEYRRFENVDTALHQFRIHEGRLPAFLQLSGIRSITVEDTGNLQPLLSAAAAVAQQVMGPARYYFRNTALVAYLRELLANSSTVAFADWALFASASDCWDALLTQVVKPLNKKDIEFIFYLGNISATPVFMVDEMLDIMGDFARYGRVTFILDQQEMMSLWQRLNGVSRTKGDLWPFDHEKRYRSLFNTLHVQQLIVYADNGVSLYASDQQFNLSRRVLPKHIENSDHARNDFINGYSMGVCLQLETALCIALGIVFYGAKGEYKQVPDRQLLLNYINTWKEQGTPIT